MYSLHSGPSGPPQLLRATSATVSNITIQWEEVDCVQRNGHIISYLLSYMVGGETIELQLTNKSFTAVGLQPYTSYTIVVKAVSFHQLGSPASIRVATGTPQGM